MTYNIPALQYCSQCRNTIRSIHNNSHKHMNVKQSALQWITVKQTIKHKTKYKKIILKNSSITKQVAAVLTMKGCIAAATQQIVLAHAQYSLYFTMNWETPSKNSSCPRGDSWFLGPTRVHDPNSILTGSATLALLTAVADTHTTDHIFTLCKCNVA